MYKKYNKIEIDDIEIWSRFKQGKYFSILLLNVIFVGLRVNFIKPNAIIFILTLIVLYTTHIVSINIVHAVSVPLTDTEAYWLGQIDGCNSKHITHTPANYIAMNMKDPIYAMGFAAGVKMCKGTFNPNYESPW